MTIYDYDFMEEFDLEEEEDELIDLYDDDGERSEDREFRSYMDICKGGFDL